MIFSGYSCFRQPEFYARITLKKKGYSRVAQPKLPPIRVA
nr:MAG TPA: hypothetical protein [Caudoviricetes sp.]